MSDFLSTLLWICGVVGSVWLAFVPWQIFKELRRQGEVREQHDVKIMVLLVGIREALLKRAEKSDPQEETQDLSTDPLQAAIDARSKQP